MRTSRFTFNPTIAVKRTCVLIRPSSMEMFDDQLIDHLRWSNENIPAMTPSSFTTFHQGGRASASVRGKSFKPYEFKGCFVAVYKEKSKSTAAETESEPVEAKIVETSEVDDLLDEIDSVLEENAQAFVENYIQKGGE